MDRRLHEPALSTTETSVEHMRRVYTKKNEHRHKKTDLRSTLFPPRKVVYPFL